MKKIYEDGTLPNGSDIPESFLGDNTPKKASEPVRPKKQVTLPPKQEQRQQQQQMQNAMPPMGYPVMPGYAPMPYPYAPVNGAEGDSVPSGVPVQNGQPVYPQGVPMPYPYMPYMYPPMPPQGAPQSVPQPTEAPKETPDSQSAGMRVLYQSPDFDLKDGSIANSEVGASFAGLQQQKVYVEQEDIEVEEVSIDAKKAAPRIIKNGAPRPGMKPEIDEVNIGNYESLSRNYASDTYQDEEYISGDIPLAIDDVNGDEGLNIQEEEQDGKKKTPTKEIIRRIVLGISIVAIIVSAGMLLREYWLSKENREFEDEVSDLIITEAPTDKKDKDKEDTTEVPLTPEQQWAQIKAEYPNVVFPTNIQLKYAKLYGENRDFVGYLSADGVNLNLPIVQADDDEKYFRRNFYGKYTKYGCPFVTHLNNIEPLDMNTVIFGHHMNDGTVFGALDKYKTIDGFKAAPVITFNTLYKDYSWKVIAVFLTNAYPEQDNGYVFRYYFTSLSTQERYSAYLNELAQRSLYDTGVDVLPTDKLLTLSTCSHEFEEARLVVVARLVRDGETAKVDVSKATVNSNPRYPQAYYDKKGIKNNPFKNANRWEVG